MNIATILATKNACYIAGNPLSPQGIVVHSTGVNNPNLSRYVAPDDGLIGENKYGNSFNELYPGGRSVCVHAFIGKLKDGSVATRQILPWDMEAWHAGGKANDTHIGFEICEDGLNDAGYFNAVWREAIELCAYLCEMFSLDPLEDGVVISHKEAYSRGLASNHGDPHHWFSKFGKTMDDFRNEVAKEMEEGMSYEQFLKYMARYEAERGALPEPNWSKAEGAWAKAREQGVMDGSRPQDPVKRVELAAILDRKGLL